MGKAAVIIFLVATGIILRFVFLDRMSFWTDELQTIEWASPVKTAGEIIYHNITYPDQSPPLFTLLLHMWMKIAPKDGHYPSEAWIRLLPAIISLLCLYFLIRIFVLPWQGYPSMGLLIIFCCSSFYLYFSREVRPYGFLLLMTLLSTWAFLNFFKRDKKQDLFIYSLSILFGTLTNPFMWLVVASHCTYLFVSKEKKRLYTIIRLTIPSLMVYLPYMAIILRQFKLYERPPLFSFFILKKVIGLFFNVTIGFNFPTNISPQNYDAFLLSPLFWISTVIIVAVFCFSLFRLSDICREDNLAILSLIFIIIPVILVLFIYPRRLGPRSLVIIAPFFHYLLIRAIFYRKASLPSRYTGIVFLILSLFFGFRFISFKINPYVPEDWRGIAEAIKKRDLPDTVFVMDSVDNLLFRYYFEGPGHADIVTYDVKADASIWTSIKSSIDNSRYSKIILLKRNISVYTSSGKPNLTESIFKNMAAQFNLKKIESFGKRLDLCIFNRA